MSLRIQLRIVDVKDQIEKEMLFFLDHSERYDIHSLI